jgi:hypothetical protein
VNKPTETTTVDVVIRLEVIGTTETVAKYRAALECLADIMRVQAEDGLWSLGSEDAETDDGPSAYVAAIETAVVRSVLIEGHDRLTQKGGN